MQLKIIWRESLPAVIFPGTWSKPERVMIGMWGVVQGFFFFCLVVSFLTFRESVWFQEVGETDLMDCEPPLLGVTFGRIVQVHFSFAGIVWVMVLFLLPVVFQTKVARLTALVYFPGMVPQGRKKDAASLLRWFLNEEVGCTMWPAELL